MGGTILAIFFVVLATLALIIAGCVWAFNSFSIIVANTLSVIFNTDISGSEAGLMLFTLAVISAAISILIKVYKRVNSGLWP